MSKPKVLLLAFFFPPETASGAARPFRFYKYLPEYGFEPWVITSSAQNGNFPRVAHAPSPTRFPNRRTLVGATEKALRLFVFSGDIAVMWPLWAMKAAKTLIAAHRFDAVISTFPPVNTHIVGNRLHRRYGLPWIADFRDPIVGNPFRSTAGLGGVVDQTLEKRFVREASALLTVTDVLREDWIRRYPAYSSKFHLLWNGYDPQECIAAAPIPSRPNRIIAHTGNLYGSRDPGPILASLNRLIDSGRVKAGSVTIRLVGDLDKLIRQARSALFEKLERCGAVEVTGHLPRSQALRELTTADYLLLLDISDRPGYAVPAKIFEYLAVGRPVLTFTDRGSPVDRIMSCCGIAHTTICRGDTDEQMDAALETFVRLSAEPGQTSEWFRQQFDGRRQTETLARLLEDVIHRKPGA